MEYSKKSISDLSLDNYKRAIVRLDLNVPIQDGRITDNNRIVQALPTLNKLLDSNLQVVVLSHLSRIKDISEVQSGKKSLKVVADEIQKLIPSKKVTFISETNFEIIRKSLEENKDTNIFVLENTRYYDVNESGEAVKLESKNSPELAKFWASLGDLYVNDAFGTSHRAHASNVGISQHLPSCVGLLVERELQYLSKALVSSDSPKVVILGGSKVSDKLKLINTILPKVDRAIIGGGMSYTFLKAKGKEVGSSIVEAEMIEECKNILKDYPDKIFLPADHVCAPEFKDVVGTIKDSGDTSWNNEMALDIGPKTIELFKTQLDDAKVVIWNGPMGVFEFDNFSAGTKAVAAKLAEITKKGAYTVIGGGDSAAAIDKFGFSSDVSFISTGGGASLSFFEGSAMPGIEAIPDKK